MPQQKERESLSYLIKSNSIKKNTDLSNLRGLSVVFNTESLYYYFTNKAYRNYVKSCQNIFIDGVALVLLGNIFSFNIQRYHGPDLLKDLEDRNILHNSILIGGNKHNNSLVQSRVIHDWIDLPYSKNYEQLVDFARSKIFDIESVPVFLISLGLPKQEIFCSLFFKDIDIKDTLIVPLGAAIDFRTGVAKRSSIIWRRLGLEWLPRLFREPRMFIRIVKSLLGLYYFLIYLIRKKFNFK